MIGWEQQKLTCPCLASIGERERERERERELKMFYWYILIFSPLAMLVFVTDNNSCRTVALRS